MKKDRLDLKIRLDNNQIVSFTLFPETDNTLFEIDQAEAERHGESPWQLIEGKVYEYSISDGYDLDPLDLNIVSRSQINPSSGRIFPGIYVGTLTIPIVETNRNTRCGWISLEVKSIKSSYRKDYQLMLKDIAERSTDLVMQQGAPISQRFHVDHARRSGSLYQKFAFLKSMIFSDEFNDALHKIILSPVTNWIEEERESDIRKIRKANNRTIRQIARSENRINVPSGHPLKEKVESVPSRIQVKQKRETIDAPENQFVKFSLSTFLSFCHTIRTHQKANKRLKDEVSQVEDALEQHLNHAIFKKISDPAKLPLNSPVLQKKEGYREIFRIWLMFDLAAKLTWEGGEDVYDAGKKDVAILYEYWLFFKLLDILKEIFNIPPKAISELIKPTEDGLGLLDIPDQTDPLFRSKLTPHSGILTPGSTCAILAF
jgi:hypothetical protein